MFGLGLMPALIKNVEETFGFTHARMGLWMGLSSICFSMAALLGGAFYDRWGAGMAMSGVLVLSAVAAVCIAFAPVAGAFVAALLFFNFANGMGSFVNPLVGRFYRRDHARGINLLHAFQGLGRLLGPVVVWLCLLVTGRWQSTFLVAAGAFTVWLVVAFVGFRDLSLHHPVPPAPHPERKGPARRPDLTLLLGLSGFIFYVGCEVVLIIWIPNFLESEAGFPKSQALLALTLLVAGMTATRLILGLIRRVARVKFVICSVAVSIAALLSVHRRALALPDGGSIRLSPSSARLTDGHGDDFRSGRGLPVSCRYREDGRRLWSRQGLADRACVSRYLRSRLLRLLSGFA
jgi:fucose permease